MGVYMNTMKLVVSLSLLCLAACEHENLIKWAKKNGASVDNVDIVTRGGHHSLVATRDLKNGTIAVSVPVSLSMCPGSFVDTSLGKALTENEKMAASINMQETGMLA